MALELLVDLGHGLVDQERTTQDQDQAAPAEPQGRDRPDPEQWLGQADDPGREEQQDDPQDQRRAESDDPDPLPLLGRQVVCEDRDEHQVLDAEHQLEPEQRQEGDPEIGVLKSPAGQMVRYDTH